MDPMTVDQGALPAHGFLPRTDSRFGLRHNGHLVPAASAPVAFDKEETTTMDMDFLTHAPFWIALGQIIIIDILLGGDNAVVIALACRKLPPAQRTKGIIYGTAGAIVLRIVLIAFAMTLLALPFLKLVGALLLVWIGIKLIAPDEDGHDNIQGSDKLFAAIKTIIVADLVMSVDNVIAIAGAAQSSGEHQMLLVALGLLISIPIIVWGSQLVIKLMERFPLIIVAGGMLLGWIAGGMLVTDPLFVNTEQWLWMPKLGSTDEQGLAEISQTLYWTAHIAGALLVLALGKFIASRRPAPAAQH
jgi:YjbE family integral membrane protein